jgi:hypothetical protein
LWFLDFDAGEDIIFKECGVSLGNHAQGGDSIPPSSVIITSVSVQFPVLFGDSLLASLKIQDNMQALGKQTYPFSDTDLSKSYLEAQLKDSVGALIPHISINGSVTVDSIVPFSYVSGTFQTEAHSSGGADTLILNNGVFWYRK